MPHLLRNIGEQRVCNLMGEGKSNAFSRLCRIELNFHSISSRHGASICNFAMGLNRYLKQISDCERVVGRTGPPCIPGAKDELTGLRFYKCNRIGIARELQYRFVCPSYLV